MATKGNREYKDTLFKFIFGNENHKEFTLSLYNAINGSNYTDPSGITFNTLEDVVYINMKNDVSFILDATMMLFEQQSSWNPNIAYRMFAYLAKLYDGYIRENNINIHSKRKIILPAPKCVVLYNGRDKDNSKDTIIHLSELYADNKLGDLDLSVMVYNINEEKLSNKLSSCKPLMEYADIVDRIRRLKKDKELGEAVSLAIDDLPDNYVIKPLLLGEKSEVFSMLQTEFDEVAYTKAMREDGAYEKSRLIAMKLLENNVPIDVISKCTDISLDEIETMKKELSNHK